MSQVLALARRSILGTIRQPAAVIPAMTFPLLFMGLIVGGAGAAADIPGFPAPSYLDFVLPGVVMQGALLGGINGGTAIATDIENGFLSRLALTPVSRPGLLMGHLAGVMAQGFVQATLFLTIGVAFGAQFATGFAGAAVLVALTVLVALASSSLAAIIAIRTRSAETVQSSFPLFFVILAFSSFFFPRELISADWFRAIASVNPATYMIEAARSLSVTGFDAGSLLSGFGAALGLAIVGLAVSSALLRTLTSRS